MNKKNVSILIAIVLLVVIGIVFFGRPKEVPQNVEVRDGVQYVTINVRGGYSPRISVAQAGVPTKLVMKTNGTYDCSSALVIKSIGYQKMLPSAGEEVIDLGTPGTGTLQGLCSMGMYSFAVNFQ